MAHSFTAHDTACNFNSAFLADNIFVSDTAVFSTVTFIVFLRSEYFLVEKTSALASPCAVIDGFRFGYFARGPREDAFRRSEAERKTVGGKRAVAITEIVPVGYEFQRGGNEMLRVVAVDVIA